MNEYTNAFKAMTLREFFAEPRLAQEFQAARFFSWVGGKLAWPLSKAIEAKTGVPAEAVEVAIRAITGERFTALPVRSFSDIVAALRSRDDNYRSCCRSALCYAVTGSREWAFGASRVAASKHDDWARHHHVYGLVHGVFADFDRALPELARAREAEPGEDVRARIGEAVELCRAALAAPQAARRPEGLSRSTLAGLPEVVRLLVGLIGEAEAEATRT